jgi:hypothetical protein
LRFFRPGLGGIALVFLFSTIAVEVPQTPFTVGTASVPPAIVAAKKVFVSNAGSDSGLFPHPFSGGPDCAYNQFYAELRSWGAMKLLLIRRTLT